MHIQLKQLAAVKCFGQLTEIFRVLTFTSTVQADAAAAAASTTTMVQQANFTCMVTIS